MAYRAPGVRLRDRACSWQRQHCCRLSIPFKTSRSTTNQSLGRTRVFSIGRLQRMCARSSNRRCCHTTCTRRYECIWPRQGWTIETSQQTTPPRRRHPHKIWEAGYPIACTSMLWTNFIVSVTSRRKKQASLACSAAMIAVWADDGGLSGSLGS